MQDILKRLENWGNEYRTHFIYKTCGSLEGAYRAPFRQWIQLHDIHNIDPIDVLDARLIEQTWKGMRSQKHKDALKYHFIHKASPNVIARRAKCRVWQVQELLGNAIGSIASLLTIHSNHTMISHNLKPGNRDFCP